MVEALYEKIGQMIRERRKALGMTQAELAAGIELSRAQLSRLERGHHGILIHTIYDIAEILDCLPGDLVPKPRRRCSTGAPICDIDLGIDALGGTRAVAKACGVYSSAVSNWRARGFFPPRLFISLSQAAKSSGVNLSQSLFREVPNANGHSA